MSVPATGKAGSAEQAEATKRPPRADAQRNIDALLQAAKAVFATSGVDAPVREIADRAGVGIGTLYRHFPQRADLIAAVFQREMDDCADAAPVLAAQYAPFEALLRWMHHYVALVGTKRGLAKALHSGDPAFEALPARFDQRLRPAFQTLFDAAIGAGEIRSDVKASDILHAVASLCMSTYESGPDHARRMVDLLVDGLRFGSRTGG